MDQQLSLEQEFELRSFAQRIQDISEIEAKELLRDLYKHKLVQENVFRYLLKDAWGIGKDTKKVMDIS
ncbi:MAG: NblA/ycf18 family protein [Microcoleaceae cyanobacterium]